MKGFLALLTAAILIGAPAVSQAQFTGDTELSQNWELRLGMFVPEKKVSRTKAGNDVWLAIGAERAFYETETWRATVSVDYYGAENIYSVPFCLNLRGNAQGIRYGVGAGFSLGHDVQSGKNALAYNFLIGYQLMAGASPITIDLRYLGTNASRQELNGWSLTVGYRF